MESEIDIEEEYNLSDEYVDDPSEHYETETWFETPDDLSDDAFYLNLSVAVVEAESDEIDAEFVEAVTEIEGKRSFPCPKCTKICKSKGGLTKHTNSKHRENDSSSTASISEQETHLSEENFVSIVEAIKTKLIKDDLFGHEINDALKNVSSSKALFQAVTTIYNMFCRKQNRDKLLEEFYGLLPTTCDMFTNCADQNVANLIMIEIPDRLVVFFKEARSRKEADKATTSVPTTSNPIELDQSERGPLSYIAGYIISKIYQTFRNRKDTSNEKLQALMRSLKSTTEGDTFISARSRGGLVEPCRDLIAILEEAEISFRRHVTTTELAVRNISTDIICASTLNSPTVKSLWENIVLDSGIDQSCSTQKLCLENIIGLYLRVRAFSYARDFISKYKINQKQTKSKALRKDLKRKKESTETCKK